MNDKDVKVDNVKKALDESVKGVNAMSEDNNGANVKQLGAYINAIQTATADKINEMDENIKKTKLAANLGATFAGLLGGGLLGYFVYNKVSQNNAAQAMATGETF